MGSLIKFERPGRLVLAGFEAAVGPLLHHVIDAFPGEIVLVPSRSQIGDRVRTLAIARRCWLLACSQEQLAELTNCERPVEGMEQLAETGVPNALVTAGAGGLYARINAPGVGRFAPTPLAIPIISNTAVAGSVRRICRLRQEIPAAARLTTAFDDMARAPRHQFAATLPTVSDGG